MHALRNLALYEQTNKKMSNLEQIQRQIQDQLNLMPVHEAGAELEFLDPFNPQAQQTTKKQQGPNQESSSQSLTNDKNSKSNSKLSKVKKPTAVRSSSKTTTSQQKSSKLSSKRPSVKQQLERDSKSTSSYRDSAQADSTRLDSRKPAAADSFLTSDLFQDPEQKRAMYMKMFLDNNQQQEEGYTGRTNDDLNQRDVDDLNYSHTFKSKIPYREDHNESNPMKSRRSQFTQNTKNYKTSHESLFDRDSQAPSKFMNETDFRGDSFNNASSIKTKMTNKDQIYVEDMDGSTGREIQFDLTRVGDGPYNQTSSTKNSKSVKHVSFKQEMESPSRQQLTDNSKQDSPSKNSGLSDSSPGKKGGEMMPQSDLQELALVLNEIQKRNDMVQAGLENQVTCENPRLLEVLMEHMVLNWDELAEDLLKDEINNL